MYQLFSVYKNFKEKLFHHRTVHLQTGQVNPLEKYQGNPLFAHIQQPINFGTNFL